MSRPTPTLRPVPRVPELVFAGSPRVVRRGGVAGGEATRNPTDTTYAAAPPSSTYRGPTIAGSEGGFIGLVTGLGLAALVAGLAFWFFYRRRQTNRRRDAKYGGRAYPDATRGTTGGSTSTRRPGKGWGRTADEDDDDAFEMPLAFEAGGLQSAADLADGSSPAERKKWLNPSTMSLDYRQGVYAGSSESVAAEDPFSDAVGTQSSVKGDSEGSSSRDGP